MAEGFWKGPKEALKSEIGSGLWALGSRLWALGFGLWMRSTQSPKPKAQSLLLDYSLVRHELPKALRDDVRLLGELLGETLRRQEGQATFDRVERVRALSKKARGGSDADFATLTRLLEQMPVEEALPVARAFSQFLNLANIAEQHHRIRRRRAYLRTPDAPPQIGSCDETFGRLIAGGIAPERLYDAVVNLRVELVFTAHPTEVTRRTLMQKFGRIADLLAMRDHVEAARVRVMGLVMTRPDDDVSRSALSMLDEALRRGDEGHRWRLQRSFDPWDVVANARNPGAGSLCLCE